MDDLARDMMHEAIMDEIKDLERQMIALEREARKLRVYVIHTTREYRPGEDVEGRHPTRVQAEQALREIQTNFPAVKRAWITGPDNEVLADWTRAA